MLNDNRFRNSIEMLTARINAMESVGLRNDREFDLTAMTPRERRLRLKFLHGMDQRLTELKWELSELRSLAQQVDAES